MMLHCILDSTDILIMKTPDLQLNVFEYLMHKNGVELDVTEMVYKIHNPTIDTIRILSKYYTIKII